MPTGPSAPRLRGRVHERDELDRVLASVRAHQSQVLVLRGDAGVGKSVLLDHLEQQASGCRVVRAAGVESEMELPYAGVHQLCSSLLDRVDALPAPQREALRTAFGLSVGAPADRFLVGLAVLTLLADVADERPLVCLVDDAQWLDRASAQVLAFVARRLLAESIVLVFAVREPTEDPALAGLPDLAIPGLGADDARDLLESVVPGLLDARVRDRIVAETRGNPLALLELPLGWSAARLAGGFVLPDGRPLAGRIEQSFLRRVHALPTRTQRLLLVAALEPMGDVPLLWRAAALLDIDADALGPAETAGLIEVGVLVRFRHPLVRSAVARSADAVARRAAHRALADATDPATDPDRRAWHRAASVVGLDESVASELERSADRALARGGLSAAAALLVRAAELTPGPADRSTRLLAAAEAVLEAGSPEVAAGLLATAELGPLTELQGAQVQRARAQIAFALHRGSDATPLLLDATRRLVPLDTALARETGLAAFAAAIFAGNLGDSRELLEVARSLPAAAPPIRADDLLLDALAMRVTGGFGAGVAPSQHALAALVAEGEAGEAPSRWLWLACRIAADLFDHDTWRELASRGVQVARETGALGVQPIAASYLAGVHMHAGEYARAAALMEESAAITDATDTAPLIATLPMLAAYRGDEVEALALIDVARRDATARGQGMALSMIGCAHAVLLNALGHYEEACEAAIEACEQDELALFALGLVELVEAAARSGRPDLAATALERLQERTSASGTDWALGLHARSRGLLTTDGSAGDHYQEAVARLGGLRVAPHLARAQLVYGEWLRREQRRVEARDQLRSAHETFTRIGASAFAERTRRELLATGEKVRSRSSETRTVLTAQEAQIARLAAAGRTNPEIGSELYISPRTVEYHLTKVFAKLDIGSRRDLVQALRVVDPSGPPSDETW